MHEVTSSITAILDDAPITNDEKKNVKKILQVRGKFCKRNIHYAANLIDPRYCGTSLSPFDQIVAVTSLTTFAKNLNIGAEFEGQIMADLAHFRAKEGHYSNYAVWEAAKTCDPLIWWKGLYMNQPLAMVAIRLLSLPTHAAAGERNWSIHGDIDSEKRNRLTSERLKKLVFIKSNLKYTSNKYADAKGLKDVLNRINEAQKARENFGSYQDNDETLEFSNDSYTIIDLERIKEESEDQLQDDIQFEDLNDN